MAPSMDAFWACKEQKILVVLMFSLNHVSLSPMQIPFLNAMMLLLDKTRPNICLVQPWKPKRVKSALYVSGLRLCKQCGL